MHLSKLPEYRIWIAMKSRCYDPKSTGFHNYGGRGIKVCGRWLHSFSAFLVDMGTRPTPKHTIDRKNNDGNYESGNCRWATRAEQAHNRRKLSVCRNGHEFTAANTYYEGSVRRCRTCRLANQRERYASREAA